MTCLQAVSGGNSSASGRGREVWFGGLSGHLCLDGWEQNEAAEKRGHCSVHALAVAVAMAVWEWTVAI